MKQIKAEKLRDAQRFSVRINYVQEKLDLAIEEALKKVDYAMETLGDKFASHSSVDNVYYPVENTSGWNAGFWTGMLWLAFELTGQEKYKQTALKQIDSYYQRIEEAKIKRIQENFSTIGHDVGFLYSLSCVAAYKLTGDMRAREAALMAADHLKYRFQEKGQFIQAWGQMTDRSKYRLIVDCLLNIPILYWATETTGDQSYAEIAYRHFRTTVDNAIREDGSSFHTFYFDPDTGAPIKGVTKQGTGDDSCWARGQGWVIYGMMLTRKYVKDPDAITICKAAVQYYMNRLPQDYIPYWDLVFDDGSGEEKDSSAATVAVCGMLELLKYLPEGTERNAYENAILLSLDSLFEHYSTKSCPRSNGLLLHAVYSKPDKVGIDECNIWGCYFYLEALTRLKKDWKLYW